MNNQKPLSWLTLANKFAGLRETRGPVTTPEIRDMLKDLNLPWKDDETPWCGVFVGAMLKRAGRAIPATPAWAKSFSKLGTKLTKPAYGSIAVKGRKGGGGHVFFVIGVTANGRIVGYGGNQSDSVCVMTFDPKDILSYTWPPAADGTLLTPTADRYNLPVYPSNKLPTSIKED